MSACLFADVAGSRAMTQRLRVRKLRDTPFGADQALSLVEAITLGKPFWPFRLRAGPCNDGGVPASKAPHRHLLRRALEASTISFAWRRTTIRAYQEV